MEDQCFDEVVQGVKLGKEFVQGDGPIRSTRRRLAERIREERELLQMISPRALRKKRPGARLRLRRERVQVRRKIRKA